MHWSGLLHLAPALLLLAALVARRYPAERRIVRLASRARRRFRPRRARRRPIGRVRAPLRARPTGGAVLAFALAGRAPPHLR